MLAGTCRWMAVVAALGAASAAVAQDAAVRPTTLTGRVLDADVRPVAEALVWIHNSCAPEAYCFGASRWVWVGGAACAHVELAGQPCGRLAIEFPWIDPHVTSIDVSVVRIGTSESLSLPLDGTHATTRYSRYLLPGEYRVRILQNRQPVAPELVTVGVGAITVVRRELDGR